MPLVLNNKIWACVQQWHECTGYGFRCMQSWLKQLLLDEAKREDTCSRRESCLSSAKGKDTVTGGCGEVGHIHCKVMVTHWMWLLLALFFSSLSPSFFRLLGLDIQTEDISLLSLTKSCTACTVTVGQDEHIIAVEHKVTVGTTYACSVLLFILPKILH